MKKFLAFSVIFVLIMTLINSMVYATDINMDLDSDSTLYGSSNQQYQSSSVTTADATVTVGSTAALSSSSLSLSNILP